MFQCYNHDAGAHFGHDKTTEKIASRFYWKNMYNEIHDFVQCCPKCQQMNASALRSLMPSSILYLFNPKYGPK